MPPATGAGGPPAAPEETMSVEQIHARRANNVEDLFRRVREEIPGATIRFVEDHEDTPNGYDWIIVSVPADAGNVNKFNRIGYETEFFKYGIVNTGCDSGPGGPNGEYERGLFYGKSDNIWKGFEKKRDSFFAGRSEEDTDEEDPEAEGHY
jgi:hypothetical protein